MYELFNNCNWYEVAEANFDVVFVANAEKKL